MNTSEKIDGTANHQVYNILLIANDHMGLLISYFVSLAITILFSFIAFRLLKKNKHGITEMFGHLMAFEMWSVFTSLYIVLVSQPIPVFPLSVAGYVGIFEKIHVPSHILTSVMFFFITSQVSFLVVAIMCAHRKSTVYCEKPVTSKWVYYDCVVFFFLLPFIIAISFYVGFAEGYQNKEAEILLLTRFDIYQWKLSHWIFFSTSLTLAVISWVVVEILLLRMKKMLYAEQKAVATAPWTMHVNDMEMLFRLSVVWLVYAIPAFGIAATLAAGFEKISQTITETSFVVCPFYSCFASFVFIHYVYKYKRQRIRIGIQVVEQNHQNSPTEQNNESRHISSGVELPNGTAGKRSNK